MDGDSDSYNVLQEGGGRSGGEAQPALVQRVGTLIAIMYCRKEVGGVGVKHSLPWYSGWGLYHHFYTEESGNNLRFMPK